MAFTIVALAAFWAMASPVMAQTEFGQYSGGTGAQMKVAVLPPPGVVLENAMLAFSATEFVDGAGNASDFDVNVLVNRTMAFWTSEKTILGGRYVALAVLPVGNFATPRPLPGQTKTSVGLADIAIQPFGLGWQSGAIHTQASYMLFVPTGRFTFGASDNHGRGFYSHVLTGAITWLPQGDRSWHVTLQGRYEIPKEIDGSDITPGEAFYLEYGVGKKVSERVDIGIVGHWTRQVGDISGSDFTGDSTRYRIAAIGPEVQWLAVQRPDWALAIQLRAYFDVSVRNASKGTEAILSFNFLL